MHYKAVPPSDGMTRLVCFKPINNTSSLPSTEAIHKTPCHCQMLTATKEPIAATLPFFVRTACNTSGNPAIAPNRFNSYRRNELNSSTGLHALRILVLGVKGDKVAPRHGPQATQPPVASQTGRGPELSRCTKICSPRPPAAQSRLPQYIGPKRCCRTGTDALAVGLDPGRIAGGRDVERIGCEPRPLADGQSSRIGRKPGRQPVGR